MKKDIILIICALLLLSCSKSRQVETPKDEVLDKGFITFFGQYYAEEGVKKNVFEIDVYSPDIVIDENMRVSGHGTNVYISDLFVDTLATRLPAGEYHSSADAEDSAFLRGIEKEGHYSGAYVLTLEPSGSYHVALVDTGTVSVSYVGDTTVIDFNLVLSGRPKSTYKGQYKGKIPYLDGRKVGRHIKGVSHLSKT